jgi:3-oxoacyl-[acyl-carrier-protein] synthase-3
MYIKGIGSALPRRSWKNSELDLPEVADDDWIFSRMGIRSRGIACSEESTLSLALEASNKALQHANIAAQEIDLVLVATVTPEHHLPSTAAQLQHRIGATRAAAFDAQAACAGFIYGLHISRAFIAAGLAKNILLCCSETLSRITNWQDQQTSPLFGDGAGAIIISADDGFLEICDSSIYCDGSRDNLLFIPEGGSASPLTDQTFGTGGHTMHMRGPDVFRHAVARMTECSSALLKQWELTIADISLVIPHQANVRIIRKLIETLSADPDRVYVNIDRHGNTSSASIPIALQEVIEAKRLRKNDFVLTTAFGAGFAWGAALLKFC